MHFKADKKGITHLESRSLMNVSQITPRACIKLNVVDFDLC